jgi:CRP/FNR family transcriptional regulator, cyclic AMP receptor protein
VGHAFDFDPSVFGEGFYAYHGPGRLVGVEKAFVDGVEIGKVAHIRQEDIHGRDMAQIALGCFEHRLEVGQGLARLRFKIGTLHLSGLGIESQLAADKDQVAGHETLGVWADGCRSLFCLKYQVHTISFQGWKVAGQSSKSLGLMVGVAMPFPSCCIKTTGFTHRHSKTPALKFFNSVPIVPYSIAAHRYAQHWRTSAMPAPINAASHPIGLSAISKTDLSLLEKSNLIDGTQWADDFSFAQVKKMAAFVDVYHVPEETVLFFEGDKIAFLVLIISGNVHVVKFDSQRNPKKITTLGPGKTIGEMSIIDGEPRSASAVTAVESTLMVMTAEKFNRLMDEQPRVALVLVQKIAKLMSQYLRQTSGRLIDHLGS